MIKLFDAWKTNSPFYNETYESHSNGIRTLIARNATSNGDLWEETGIVARYLYEKADAEGLGGLGIPEVLSIGGRDDFPLDMVWSQVGSFQQ